MLTEPAVGPPRHRLGDNTGREGCRCRATAVQDGLDASTVTNTAYSAVAKPGAGQVVEGLAAEFRAVLRHEPPRRPAVVRCRRTTRAGSAQVMAVGTAGHTAEPLLADADQLAVPRRRGRSSATLGFRGASFRR